MDRVGPAYNTLLESHREGPCKYSVLESAALVEGKREEGAEGNTLPAGLHMGLHVCLSSPVFYLV